MIKRGAEGEAERVREFEREKKAERERRRVSQGTGDRSLTLEANCSSGTNLESSIVGEHQQEQEGPEKPSRRRR